MRCWMSKSSVAKTGYLSRSCSLYSCDCVSSRAPAAYECPCRGGRSNEGQTWSLACSISIQHEPQSRSHERAQPTYVSDGGQCRGSSRSLQDGCDQVSGS